MIRRLLLVVLPLTAVYFAGTLTGGIVTEPKGENIAQAAPYLSVTRCHQALTGRDGSDNDVWREIHALNVAGSNVVRWAWGGSSRNGPGHVFTTFFMRRASGQLVQRFYMCGWTSSYRVADSRFTPLP